MHSLKSLRACAILIFTLIAQPLSAGELVVSAEGVVEVVPDMAVITLGVEKQGRTAAAALSENNMAMAELLALLKASGIEDRDMQSRGLRLDPQYTRQNNSGPARIAGYIAHNQVHIRVRDLAKLGGLLDAAISSGGNQFSGLNFDVQEKGPLQDQALANAVQNARAKAQIMADAAGVTLGPITDMREAGSRGGPVPILRMEAMAADAVPIAEGSIGIKASVTLTFEITSP